ncbi:MAG: ribosome recycling factor [bacterium]
MGEDILKSLVTRLTGAIEAVKKDLSSIRTGRAKPSMVENVKVEAYGAYMELRELASITAPDTTLIVISPWDKSLINAIANGIRKADLNVNPIVDGETVKIAIASLTEERRQELVKMTHQKLETGRVMIRQVRAEIKEEIEKLEDESGVSEDDVKRWLSEMQKTVEEYMGKIDLLGKEKQIELLTL